MGYIAQGMLSFLYKVGTMLTLFGFLACFVGGDSHNSHSIGVTVCPDASHCLIVLDCS
jgi:hypothetical protein